MDNYTITVYGTWWCGDCIRARKFLDRYHLAYKWIDIDKDMEGEKFVLSTNHGMRSVPTILCEDGSILVEPSNIELQQKFGTISTTGKSS